jgi:protein translocase SecG subunit
MADMRQLIFSVAIMILSTLLVGSVLLQQRGSGLGAAFGGEGTVFRTKRGIEKGLHYATVALSVLFFATALLNLLLA